MSIVLYYYRARYYSPALGRFISEDPTSFRGGLNAYLYGGSSPTNFVDPTGETPLGIVVGLTLGGFYNVLANAGKFGEPGGPTVLQAWVAGEVGGAIGGAIDNPAVAAGVAGAVQSVIQNWGKPIPEVVTNAAVTGLVDAVGGLVGGATARALGANEVTQFAIGFSAVIWSENIVNLVIPGAIAATPRICP